MKIATFNVNGITARLPVVLNRLEAFRPNIVCLQELKIPQERFPADGFVRPATVSCGTAR